MLDPPIERTKRVIYGKAGKLLCFPPRPQNIVLKFLDLHNLEGILAETHEQAWLSAFAGTFTSRAE